MSDTAISEPFVSADDYRPPSSLGRVQRGALVAAVVGAVLCAVGLATDSDQFFQSYLVGYVYWLVIAIGCLGWSMIQHLTGGSFALVLRKVLEAAAATLPLLAVLFVPLAFGMEAVFPWARPEAAGDALIQSKAAYLNVGFFFVRAALYFAIWILMAWLLARSSRHQDETGERRSTIRMRLISGPGIVVFVLVGSFASWDWLMSLDPHWFSSLFGFWFISSTALASLLFMTVVAWYLAGREPMNAVLSEKNFHDYGKLTLALVMFWAYMTLSQFLITWSGHIPEFTVWYGRRNTHGWKLYTVLLVIFHFFVPFLLLLSAKLKKRPKQLVTVALFLLVMRWADLYWQAGPNFHEHLTVHYLDLAAPLAIGGVWLWFFVAQLKKRALLPLRDPYLPEILPHG